MIAMVGANRSSFCLRRINLTTRIENPNSSPGLDRIANSFTIAGKFLLSPFNTAGATWLNFNRHDQAHDPRGMRSPTMYSSVPPVMSLKAVYREACGSRYALRVH